MNEALTGAGFFIRRIPLNLSSINDNSMQVGKIVFQNLVWRGLYYVSAFVLNLLIARHYEASVSGSVYYISNLYSLLILVMGFSLDSGIVFFTARNQVDTSRVFRFSLCWSLFSGAMVFLLAYAFAPSRFETMPASLLVFSAVCFITGNMLSAAASAFFAAQRHFFIPNLIGVLVTILQMLLIPYKDSFAGSFITEQTYFYVYFGAFLLQGVCTMIAAGARYADGFFGSLLSRTDLRMLLRYCAMAWVGNMLYFLLYRIDYWFVEYYCDAGQLGNYIQVSKLGQLFFVLPGMLAGAVFPIAAGNRNGNLQETLALISRVVFFTYLLCCLLLALFGNWLFPFAFGNSFSGMYQPFLFLVPGILALSCLFTLTAYLSGKGLLAINLKGASLALLVVLAGDMIFIPTYGTAAAAAVSSIGYIIYLVYILLSLRKEFALPLHRFFIVSPADLRQLRSIMTGIVSHPKQDRI